MNYKPYFMTIIIIRVTWIKGVSLFGMSIRYIAVPQHGPNSLYTIAILCFYCPQHNTWVIFEGLGNSWSRLLVHV
jgi:hypothetical protein